MKILKRIKTGIKVGYQAFKLSRTVPESALSLDNFWDNNFHKSIGRCVIAHTYDGSTRNLHIIDRAVPWREAKLIRDNWVKRFGEIDRYEMVKVNDQEEPHKQQLNVRVTCAGEGCFSDSQ